MAKETVSRGKSAMGGHSKPKKSSGSKAHSIHIHRGKSGGFILHHHPKDPGGAVEQHVLPDLAALQQHIGDQMGDQGAAPAPTPDPTQQVQAGPPAAGPVQGAPAGM
jgi:hypothetical protein